MSNPVYDMVGESPYFTVSEFVAVFNQSLEMLYPQVVIQGELSNFRVSKGKWVYFDLKDDVASVKFFGSVFNLPGPLQDGLTCEVIGRPRLHPQFGFSISFEAIRPTGEGSIKKARDLLERKLRSEGLFAAERKRSLPYPPQRIGLITSAESAAIADFRKIITARWPKLEIVLSDTLVQGAEAPAAIRKAVEAFNLEARPPEVLVIIRGGGSADDLAAFSEESVVRAVAASRIPTLVAIGHENDISLAELAADQRASTPSNAAELLVPDVAVERQQQRRNIQLLKHIMSTICEQHHAWLAATREEIDQLLADVIRLQRHELDRNGLLLQALDPLQPLERGYAIVRSSDGKQKKRASMITTAERLQLQFKDGTITVTNND